MLTTKIIWQRLLGLLPGEVTLNETRWLIRPCLHMPLMEQRRVRMIVNRVRLFATLFAALTPLWIIVDVLTLPFPLWLQLAILRLLATIAFGTLVMWHPQDGRLATAYQGMATLFAIPTLFYVISHLLLSHHQLQGISAAIGTGYAFLPFVLLAGFAIFPLTLFETLTFAAPVLCAYALALMFNWEEVSWPSFGGQFWLLFLLTGVASLASMSQLAFIIALVNQAIHDPLTGTFSRRSGEEMLNLHLSFARRNNSPFTVAFLDIDHFKSINDRFGHEFGDRVLQQLTQTVTHCLRRGDIVVRWGGEEFLLLLNNTDLHQAAHALERLRQHGFGMHPDGRQITASIGVAERIADGTDDWKVLVEKADTRMYLAKQRGRDRLVCEG
ncbi:GGDEF domain-containing protein [Crenobacter sp. SG2305]|uniref:GGDEF domain-containing protein n=1 Tax=Crenobacter oryzisoli TaxID=3056844 RepID=UPI0025AAC101|nr:GGDEF domain-containing protein [Crenobacter sp. SG2305]MDN0082986.1 GGDEF domain-containing protein [Crenobacter sp. SG2305]